MASISTQTRTDGQSPPPGDAAPSLLAPALIAAATFALALAVILARGLLTAPTTPYNEQFRMASYLAQGHGYVCPVGPLRDDPSSWYSPGYVTMMAGVMRLLGTDSPATMATIRLLNITALAVSAGLVFLIGRKIAGVKAAYLAAVLFAFNPAVLYKADEIWDTCWAMLAGVALLWMFVCHPPRRWLAAYGGGLACGAAALINPAWTLCYPIWVISAWWRSGRRRSLATLAAYAGLTLAGLVVAILPWTVRNWQRFGELVYMRGNLPLEMWVGNAPWSDGFLIGGRNPHPVFDAHEAQRMVELGEHGYFKACAADVKQWWRQDPARFGRLAMRRVVWFWTGYYKTAPSLKYKLAKFATEAVLASLALVGAIVLIRRRRFVLPLTAAVFPLIYYVTTVAVRYRVPLEGVLMVLAAVGVLAIAGLLRRRPKPAAAS